MAIQYLYSSKKSQPVTITKDIFDNNLIGGRFNRVRNVLVNTVTIQKTSTTKEIAGDGFAYWQFTLGDLSSYEINDLTITLKYEISEKGGSPLLLNFNNKEFKKVYPSEPVQFNPKNLITNTSSYNFISISPSSTIYLQELSVNTNLEYSYGTYLFFFLISILILFIGYSSFKSPNEPEEDEIKITFSKAESYDKLSEILLLIESTETSVELLESSYSKGDISKKTFEKLVNEAEEHLNILGEEKESHKKKLSEIIDE